MYVFFVVLPVLAVVALDEQLAGGVAAAPVGL